MSKVSRGQPAQIEARQWNRFVEAAETRLGQEPGNRSNLAPDFVMVKNSLGRNLARYSAVCIGAPSTLPSGTNDPIFPLINPSLQNLQTKTGRAMTIGILPEPIANGRTGRAQISGITPARFRENENANSAPILYGDMSDKDDMLVAGSMGAISVLSTDTNFSSGSTRLFWVRLGQHNSLASTLLTYTIGTWNALPSYSYNYGTDLYYNVFGDCRRLGLYSSTQTQLTPVSPFIPAGNIFIGRTGRFEVSVDFAVSPKTSVASASSGDRFEYVVNWGDLISDWGSISYSAWTGLAELGANGKNWRLGGQRSFMYNQAGNYNSTTPAQIWLPGISIKRLNSSGAVQETLAMQGTGNITVTYLGPAVAGIAPWTLAQKNAVWGRSTTGGPIT